MSAPEATVPDLFRLDGKVAIVTGASSGLGVAFAQGLAEAGADVVLGARRVDRLAETAALVEAAGRKALCVETDVAKVADCDRIVALAMEELGHVDVLVNKASPPPVSPRPRTPPPRRASTGSPATWRSSGPAARASGSTRSPRASSPPR